MAQNPNGDRNKKPQEVQEDEVKKSFADIPHDVTEHYLALTPRRHYPNLSLASKTFRRILLSPELYHLRTTLGVTEPILYVSIGFPPSETPSWHALHRDHVSLRLRKIASLPCRLLSAVATIGTEMYVLGGSVVGGSPTSDVNLIDFRFHTSRSLPSMKRTRSRAVAEAIDGKVYVIGGCRKKSDDWVEVFDVKTQSWSEMPGVLPRAHWEGQFVTSAVMDGKIFVLDPSRSCLVFDPRVGSLVEWDDRSELRSLWQASSCVVDDMLYTVDPGCSLEYPIVVYDPKAKEKRWRPVHGVLWGRDWPSFLSYYDSKMANLGGKLLILVCKNALPQYNYGRQQVWCVEIALERHGDDIFGRVESTELVLAPYLWPSIELSRTVIL